MPVEEGIERIWFWLNLPCKISGMDWVGVFKKVWKRPLEIYDESKGMGWNWQSMDSVPKAH